MGPLALGSLNSAFHLLLLDHREAGVETVTWELVFFFFSVSFLLWKLEAHVFCLTSMLRLSVGGHLYLLL